MLKVFTLSYNAHGKSYVGNEFLPSKSRLKMSKIRQKYDQIFKRGETKIRSSPVQQIVNQNMDLQQLQTYLGLKSQWVGSC